MKKLFIIMAIALCFAGCTKDGENPVYGKRYRWDTDMPPLLNLKTKNYYQVYEFSGKDICEVYYTDVNGGISNVSASYSYNVKGSVIQLIKEGNYFGYFKIKSPKYIILREMNGHELNQDYFLY